MKLMLISATELRISADIVTYMLNKPDEAAPKLVVSKLCTVADVRALGSKLLKPVP